MSQPSQMAFWLDYRGVNKT